MSCTVLLHGSLSNLHIKDVYDTFICPCFWRFDTMHKVYTLLSFSAHPFSAFSSGKADDKPKVSVCWLLLSVQTCCSQQLAERPLGMHSVLIVSWVYICFIFRLLLDPGRQKEAQSFPRVRIFLQEDRRWSLWVTQFLSTISQTASLPITFPDYLHSLLFTAAASFSCVFP